MSKDVSTSLEYRMNQAFNSTTSAINQPLTSEIATSDKAAILGTARSIRYQDLPDSVSVRRRKRLLYLWSRVGIDST